MTMIRFGPHLGDDVWGQCGIAGVRPNGSDRVESRLGIDPDTHKNALLLIDSAPPGVEAKHSTMVLISPSLAPATVSTFVPVLMQTRTAIGFRVSDASFRSRVFIIGEDFSAEQIADLQTQGISVVKVTPATQEALVAALNHPI